MAHVVLVAYIDQSWAWPDLSVDSPISPPPPSTRFVLSAWLLPFLDWRPPDGAGRPQQQQQQGGLGVSLVSLQWWEGHAQAAERCFAGRVIALAVRACVRSCGGGVM